MRDLACRNRLSAIQILQLATDTNIDAYTKALPGHLLPKPISDAIEVTKKMGIRFLWVDALCILQDNEEDKREQIAITGFIYKNATCTIAAASAEKVSDGFLSNAKVDDVLAKLPFYLDEGEKGFVFLRTEQGEYNDHEDGPLFSLGWALQEMLLSQRLLIFDAYQLVLSCEEAHLEAIEM
jgi:hypothetical protein